MNRTRQLVVGVDGSPTSAAALRWAIGQAQATGSEVRAVAAWEYPTAVDPESIRLTAQEMAEAHRREVDEFVRPMRVPGVPVASEAIEGDPAEVLLAAAQDAELLVLGRHGHGRVMRALIGSVSAKCLRAATCPVVVLPPQGAEGEGEAREAIGTAGYEPGPIV